MHIDLQSDWVLVDDALPPMDENFWGLSEPVLLFTIHGIENGVYYLDYDTQIDGEFGGIYRLFIGDGGDNTIESENVVAWKRLPTVPEELELKRAKRRAEIEILEKPKVADYIRTCSKLRGKDKLPDVEAKRIAIEKCFKEERQ